MVPSIPSHALIAHDDAALGRRMVLQAEAHGFEHITWDQWMRKNILLAELIPTGKSLERALRWLSGYLGSAYDFKSAFLVWVRRIIGRMIRFRFDDPAKLMCAEAVIRMLREGSYGTVADPEMTSAYELLFRLMGLPLFKVNYMMPTTREWLKARLINRP